jgi:hypothetical protein
VLEGEVADALLEAPAAAVGADRTLDAQPAGRSTAHDENRSAEALSS